MDQRYHRRRLSARYRCQRGVGWRLPHDRICPMTEQMSAKEYRDAFAKERKPSKYRNVRTTVDGITFDSKREAERYGELKTMEAAGVISDLELQPRFPLTVNDE